MLNNAILSLSNNKNTYSEGWQDPSRRQDLDRLQKVERHVFLGCIRESNVKVVANKCGGVIQESKTNSTIGQVGVQNKCQLKKGHSVR